MAGKKRKKSADKSVITEYIESKKSEVCELLDSIFAELSNPERLANAPINQLSSVLSTLIDTFGENEKDGQKTGTLFELFDEFKNIK